MKINRSFLPIKFHYFFFLGCMSPVLPFMNVVARQMGISIAIQGTLQAITLLITVLAKPILAALADSFPNYRKALFILFLSLMIVSLSSISLMPSMRPNPVIRGSFYNREESIGNMSTSSLVTEVLPKESVIHVLEENSVDCYVNEASQCSLILVGIDFDNVLYDEEKIYNVDLQLLKDSDVCTMTNSSFSCNKLYKVSKVGNWSYGQPYARVECEKGIWNGDTCKSVLRNGYFWLYCLLIMLGCVLFTTSNSITDAICMDSIAKESHYGYQRAWGTVGWGAMGPISGLLVDLCSGRDYYKNYTPAFVLHFVLGCVDVFIASVFLKVKKYENASTVWKNLKPLFAERKFVMFLFFIIFNGAYDGVVASYIFLLQEDMVEGTAWVPYLKLLNGFTLFVMCSVEAPFMFLCGWLMKRMSAESITSLVFFLYIFRLFGHGLVGLYGPVWATLIVELLNGPCYGLGYTAIVVYAGQITPPGISATVQSVVNICYESMGYGLAYFVGGIIYQYLGGPMMYISFGIFAIPTLILHLIMTHYLIRKPGVKAEAEECAQRLQPPEMAHENGEASLPLQNRKAELTLPLTSLAVEEEYDSLSPTSPEPITEMDELSPVVEY